MQVKTLGLPHYAYCNPFAGAAEAVRLHVAREAPAIVSRDLESGALTAGFISPIDFAKNASVYRIVPGAGVASFEGRGSLTIRFRPGARTVRTLAIPAIAASDIILARLLLSEKFGISPAIVPVAGSPETMLAKADAALIAPLDPDAVIEPDEGLDLVEEWVQSTGLPYLHGLIATREGELEHAELEALAGAGLPHGSPTASDPLTELTASPYAYGLSDEVMEGFREFLQYAYYHGILPDVPDLKFFGEE